MIQSIKPGKSVISVVILSTFLVSLNPAANCPLRIEIIYIDEIVFIDTWLELEDLVRSSLEIPT